MAKKLLTVTAIIVAVMCLFASCSEVKDSPAPQTHPAVDASEILANISEYDGAASVTVNDNMPLFSDDEIEAALEGSYEHYGDLDKLGRCTSCIASIDVSLMPPENSERGDISSVHPTGWMPDMNWERCHLIAHCLTGQDDNILNLITGTHYFNTEGMLPYEVRTANYLRQSGNHVLYRVTPVYDGDNMIASGVLMEAMSLEDDGEGLSFCVYCYNVYPDENTIIDYVTGEVTHEESEPEDIERTLKYVLNISSMKIHYPDCRSVGDMAEHNKKFVYDETIDELEAQGYDPCGNCHPV